SFPLPLPATWMRPTLLPEDSLNSTNSRNTRLWRRCGRRGDGRITQVALGGRGRGRGRLCGPAGAVVFAALGYKADPAVDLDRYPPRPLVVSVVGQGDRVVEVSAARAGPARALPLGPSRGGPRLTEQGQRLHDLVTHEGDHGLAAGQRRLRLRGVPHLTRIRVEELVFIIPLVDILGREEYLRVVNVVEYGYRGHNWIFFIYIGLGQRREHNYDEADSNI
ncbi:hypothetical protein B0T24DRAFT_626086, partial [Lasiosphaeria ovina]